jgi:hypothetical protein
VSHLYNHNDTGLADQTKQIPCHYHLTDTAGLSTSSAKFFNGLKLTNDLQKIYIVLRIIISFFPTYDFFSQEYEFSQHGLEHPLT